MKLGFKDLHPSVADILRSRMSNLRFGHNVRAEDAEAHTVIGRRWKGIGWRILGAIPVGAVLGAGVASLAGGHGGQLIGASFMSAYLAAIGTGLGSVVINRLGQNVSLSPEELRALASGLDLGRPEMIYLDSVCALLEAGDNVSEQTGRDILTTLNELLEQARYVCGRLDRLRRAASTESIVELEDERKRLASRMAQASDPQAKSDLEQSLAICDDRLRNAKVLEPLIERMDAQREVIVQTLLSVQSSASRLQVAPAALSAPDVEEVRRVIGEVTAQTQAVEHAVEEVMSVRA
jgi:hypothetical protein